MVLSCFDHGAPADYGVVCQGTIEDVVTVLGKQMTLLRQFFFLGTHTSEIVDRTATSTTSAITVHHPFNGLYSSRNGMWGLATTTTGRRATTRSGGSLSAPTTSTGMDRSGWK